MQPFVEVFALTMLPSALLCGNYLINSNQHKVQPMMKSATRMMVAAAAASLAFAPIAAQAGTRAGDSGAVFAASSAPGMGRSADGESLDSGTSIILALLAAGLVIAGIVAAADSNDNGQSPGT